MTGYSVVRATGPQYQTGVEVLTSLNGNERVVVDNGYSNEAVATTGEIGWVGVYYLKNLGALLDGLSSDEANIQAAYNELPNNATVIVPIGNWPASWNLTPNVNKSVFWNLLGTLDIGTAAQGTAPVGYIGDGDVVAGYNAFNPQSYGFGKQIINSGGTGTDDTARSVVDMNFINNNPNNYLFDVFSTLTVNSTSQATASGFMWGIQSNVYSYNNGNVGGGSQGVQNVAIAANVLRQPGSNNSNWAFFGQISDNNGLPPSAFGGQLLELDYFTVGYDYAGGTNASYYDPANGGRQFIYLRVAQCSNGPYNFGTWAANTNYTVDTPIYPLTASGYVYICTVAGRSAGTQPTWPTTIGQTVTDGGVTWKCSIANISEVSRGIELTTDEYCNFGAGIIFGGNYTDAFIDCTYGNFLYQGGNNPCAIRLRAGMLIDWGAEQGVAASQNQFIMGLSGAGQGFEYIVGGNLVFQCTSGSNLFYAANGLVSGSYVQINGFSGPTWGCGTALPTATQPIGSLYSKTNGTVGARLYVSAGGGTWNAVAGV